MSRSVASRHIRTALSRWPADPLRQEHVQMPAVLTRRLERLEAGTGKPKGPELDLLQANALYSLLDNRYKNRYRVREEVVMRPRANPSYYDDLIKELDEVPRRGILGRLAVRIKGMFRLQ